MGGRRGLGADVIEDLTEYGTGALEEEIEAEPIAALFGVAALAAPPPEAIPGEFKTRYMGPALNQGNTPRCVSFGLSSVQRWHDYLDRGRRFDFAEKVFAERIGTTQEGAFLSDGLKELKTGGYPVVDVGEAQQHRIQAFFRVTLNKADIQRAIMSFGPLVAIGSWAQSWMHPFAEGLLPNPAGDRTGHCTVAYGWNARGLRFRNSWGEAWGADGDFVLPWKHLRATDNGDVQSYVNRTTTRDVNVRASAGRDDIPGEIVGRIKDGAALRCRRRVPGASRPGDGDWFPVVAINGRSVGERWPGHPTLYVPAAATA